MAFDGFAVIFRKASPDLEAHHAVRVEQQDRRARDPGDVDEGVERGLVQIADVVRRAGFVSETDHRRTEAVDHEGILTSCGMRAPSRLRFLTAFITASRYFAGQDAGNGRHDSTSIVASL